MESIMDAIDLGEGRVRLEREGHVAHVRLNRPEAKNALDRGMFEGLLEAARLQKREPTFVGADS